MYRAGSSGEKKSTSRLLLGVRESNEEGFGRGVSESVVSRKRVLLWCRRTKIISYLSIVIYILLFLMCKLKLTDVIRFPLLLVSLAKKLRGEVLTKEKGLHHREKEMQCEEADF